MLDPADFTTFARFEMIDLDRDRRRAYLLVWQPCLFGGGALMKSWGRIGQKPRTTATLFADRAAAQDVIEATVRRRLRHGYLVVEVS